MMTFNFLRWQPTPPYPPSLTAYITPQPPTLFNQNDRKGCTLDNLDGLGLFLFGFGATGKKISRGGNHPHPLGG